MQNFLYHQYGCRGNARRSAAVFLFHLAYGRNASWAEVLKMSRGPRPAR